MAQKEDNKEKQLKQKQRQYQKQSVVVNVNTATKRRRAAGKKSPTSGTATSIIASAVDSVHTLQYSPQTMFDQSSI
jgi:quinolinate synthase